MEEINLDPERTTWLDRLQAGLEVLLVSGIVSSYLAFLPFYTWGGTEAQLFGHVELLCALLLLESAITLLMIVVLVSVHRQRWRDLGFDPTAWRANTLIGLAVVPVLFLTNGLVAVLVRRFLPNLFSERNPLIESIKSPSDLVIFAFTAVIAGGFKEEVQRAFVLARFRDHLGGAKVGLVLWSAAFGAGHYIQGAQGAIAAGIYGLVFGGLYLARSSLVAPVVAHAIYDVAALVGYWMLRGSKLS